MYVNPVWIQEPPDGADLGVLLRGNRAESWRVEVLDAEGGTLTESLEGAQSVSLAWDDAPVPGSGSLSWEGEQAPDWLHITLRPWYQAEFPGGGIVTWPLGEFVPSTPGAEWDDGSQAQNVDLYDKLLHLSEQELGDTFSVDSGTNAVAKTRELLLSHGIPEARVAIQDSPEVLQSPMTWDAKDSVLTVLNDLLAAVGFTRLRTDGYGTYSASKAVLDDAKPVSWVFLDGPDGIYEPQFQVTRDTYKVPNRIKAVGRSEGGFEGLVSIYDNVDPESPFSQQSRGRVIVRTFTDVEASSQEVLDQFAERKMAEAMRVTATISLTHWTLPLAVGEVVTFGNRAAMPDPLTVSLVNTRLELDENGLSTSSSNFREVVTL